MPADDEWHTYTFDWSSPDEEPAGDGYVYPNHYTDIHYLLLETVKDTGQLYEAVFWMDDVRIGYEVDHPSAVEDIPGSGTILLGNDPNPFRENTLIRFTLPGEKRVSLTVYDLSGRVIAVLLDQQWLPGGKHTVRYSPARPVPGIYLYELRTDSYKQMKRMILIK